MRNNPKINLNNRGDFQTILLIVFGALILLAVLIFSGIIPGFGGAGGQKEEKVDLVVWGFLPSSIFAPALENFNQTYTKTHSLTYVEKRLSSYETELLEALAVGTGPDIFMISQDMIAKQKNKMLIWPFTVFSERAFKDSFVDGAEIFLQRNGVIAMPLLIDPMVLYWNKELFAGKGIAQPPATWEEFQNISKQLTTLDKSGNIIFSGAALGLFSNINNAKDIIASLILQTGNPVTSMEGEKIVSRLSGSGALSNSEVGSAIDFYTRFSNVRYDAYSWNYALPNSLEAFTAGNLAMYLGFGSEVASIKAKNPHLIFDVAIIPKLGSKISNATMSNIYALAISKNVSVSQQSGAMGALMLLTDPYFLKILAESNSYAPASRILLAKPQERAERATIYKSAVSARSWPDPSPQETSEIFKEMVESILSGRSRAPEALETAHRHLEAILNKI